MAALLNILFLIYHQAWIESIVALSGILFLFYRQAWIKNIVALSGILFLFYSQTWQAITNRFASRQVFSQSITIIIGFQ